MNLFDMKTVILSYILSNAICMLVVFFLWRQNRRRFAGLGFWLTDFVMQFLALLLVALRGAIPDLLSMTVSNTLIIGGTILLYVGLEHFLAKRGQQWQNILLLAVFIPLHVYFVIYPNLSARNILFSLALLAICAQIAWLLLRRVDTGMLPLTRSVGLLFVVYGWVSIVRIVIDANISSGNDFFHSDAYDTFLVLLYQLLFIILTFSLFLLVNLRLTRNLELDILARVEAETALKLSEEKFQKAFHSSPDAIIISQASDGQIVEANEGFSRLTEYSREEALSSSSIALDLWVIPQEREAFVRTLKEKLRLRDVEYDFRAKSGKILKGLLSAEIIQLGDEPYILSITHDITNRKRTEEAVVSLAKFPAENPNPVLRVDGNGVILYANQSSAPILNAWQCQVNQSIPADWQKLASSILASGQIHEHEMECAGRLFALTFTPVANENYLNLYGRDITERKKMETALRASDERYQTFISQSFEAIYRTEFDHPIDISLPVETQIDLIYDNAYIAECNQALAEMYNRPSVAAMIGGRLLEAHGGKDNPVNRAAFRKLIRNGYKSSNDETMEYDAFGNPLWFLNNTVGMVENGQLVRLWGTSINITERKRDDELVQLRLRLIQFADAHTLDELLQRTLDEAEALTNSKIGFFHFVEQDQNTLSLQAWSTRTVREFCHAEGKGMHYDLADAGVWVDCVRERRPIVHNDYASLPHRKGLPDGHAQVLRELVVPVFRENHIMAIMGVGNKPQDYTERDLNTLVYIADVVWETTARKRAEEATIRLNAELEQRVAERTAELEASNRELESLSYNIAHDMRSPVRAMVGYSVMLQQSKGEKLDTEASADLEIIVASARHLGQLIDDFLTYLRLGRAPIQKKSVDVGALVNQVKEAILSKNPQRQIQFSIGALPDCQGDWALMEQVWIQLISNAVKFTRRREIARIEIGSGEQEGKQFYFIRDNGIGFDMEYADKIFGIFQHLNRQDEYEGTGVGLAIVQRVLQRHGGRIWVEAEEDKGAAFYFTL